MTHGRAERHLRALVGDLPPPLPSVIGAVPILGSVLEGGNTPTFSIPPSTPTNPSNPPAIPSPSPSNPPSPSPSNPPSPSTPPSPSPSPNPSPTTPPTTPSSPAPTNPPAPSPSTLPSFLSAPPPLNNPPSRRPSTPSTPQSNPSPSQPSPQLVQSPTNPSPTGDSFSPSTDSPSPTGDSSPSPSGGSDGSNTASPSSGSSDTLGSSLDGGILSSPSPTTPPGLLSSPSTQNGPSPTTNGFILSTDGILSSITSTTGASGSLAPQDTNVATGSSPLPDTISTQSPVIVSGSPSLSSATAPRVKNIGTGSSPIPHTLSTQSPVIISGSLTLVNNPSSTNGPNSVSSALASPHHQLSAGQIAAIIIVLLIFLITLPIVVFILRRRSQLHRADRSTKWWFATTRSSELYGDGTTEQLIPPGTHTARSSFGTSVDHSESNTPLAYVLPPFPSFPSPMAEMGRGNASRPALVIDLDGNSNNNNLGDNRLSVGSVGSDHSQYLIVSPQNGTNPDLQVATPMSVRPFSPSESFAFPKPPEPVATGSGPVLSGGGSSRPMSNATSIIMANTPLLPPGLSTAPSSFVPLVGPKTTKKSPSFTTTKSSENSITPPIDASPYSDIPVQVVCRAFEPTLPDELAVNLGDGVRVLHTFDDGWGLIEKVQVGRDGRGREEERGLIPMACLRTTGEDLGQLEIRSESRGSSINDGPCAL